MNSINSTGDIFTLGQAIETHINQHAQAILASNLDALNDEFARVGDEAYGTYLKLLFAPVHQQLKMANLRAVPGLPGNFGMSREWGNADETDQQRWMWSTIKVLDKSSGRKEAAENTSEKSNTAIGTIVVIVFHDHSQFRLPRLPQIIALKQTSKQAVVETLSQRSEEFKHALEFKDWYAEYLKSLG